VNQCRFNTGGQLELLASEPLNNLLSSPPTSAGYGNIAPSTEGGKIFCILYAIFGIPLFGFLLAGIGDQLGTMFMKSILKVEKVFRVSRITLE